MTLLMLCLFPLLKTHINLTKERRKQIEQLQYEQEVQAILCQVKILLFEQTYRWEELMQGIKDQKYTIKKILHSTKNAVEGGMILEVTIPLKKQTFKQRIYLEKARFHTH